MMTAAVGRSAGAEPENVGFGCVERVADSAGVAAPGSRLEDTAAAARAGRPVNKHDAALSLV